MKVLKILLSNCTFFTSQPAYGKTFNHWSKTLSGVLKIFSLVKHRNAAIFLVTISQINIPTTKTKKLIFGTTQIWLFSNPSLVTCLGTCGVFSNLKRFMFLVNQTTNYVTFFASFSDENKIEVSYFSNLLEMRENY